MGRSITDPEFGAIAIRRIRGARHIRLKVDARGAISISMPFTAPLLLAKGLIAESRENLRRNIAELQSKQQLLQHGDAIGKSHTLHISQGESFSSRLLGTQLHVVLPASVAPTSGTGQKHIKTAALKALRTQAKAYLPRRLKALAETHEYTYKNVRFSNAGTRWGSCSSTGTISLNIWLMQLPFELIDYVLIHELCHTKEMNHSTNFWQRVEAIVPNYKSLRKSLKDCHPY